MDNADYPTSPVNAGEQRRIMRDLEASKRQAHENGDVLREAYITDALLSVKFGIH